MHQSRHEPPEHGPVLQVITEPAIRYYSLWHSSTEKDLLGLLRSGGLPY